MIELAKRLPMADLLRYQDRLISRGQALAGGLKPPVLDGHRRRGRWQRVLPTVYLTEPATADKEWTIRSRRFIRAVWMWAGDDALQAALDRGAHRRGWATARVAVRETATNPHSEAERLTHRGLLAAGISDWRANAELVIRGRTFRPDLIFDEVKLIVEIDGFA